MKAIVYPRLLALVLVLLAAGCTGQEDQTRALQNRVAEQEAEISRLRQEMSETSGAVTQVRPAQANLHAAVEDLRVRQARLEGRVEDLLRRYEAMRGATDDIKTLQEEVGLHRLAWQETQAQLALELEAFRKPEPVAGLEPGPLDMGNATAAAGQANATATDEQADTAAPMLSEASPDGLTEVIETEDAILTVERKAPQGADPAKALYDQALAEFKARNYQNAQTIWAEFTQAFKDHELAPNAHFWQGECFYQMGDYARAVLAYQEVIARYPKSVKYRPALLKQGVSFIKLGKDKAGRLLLEDVVAKYPDTAEARRAKEFLGR